MDFLKKNYFHPIISGLLISILVILCAIKIDAMKLMSKLDFARLAMCVLSVYK